MQSTGRYDSKGVELYEGDILDLQTKSGQKHPPHVIQWREDRAKFVAIRADGEHGSWPNDEATWVKIGTIYENPDLLPKAAAWH